MRGDIFVMHGFVEIDHQLVNLDALTHISCDETDFEDGYYRPKYYLEFYHGNDLVLKMKYSSYAEMKDMYNYWKDKLVNNDSEKKEE